MNFNKSCSLDTYTLIEVYAVNSNDAKFDHINNTVTTKKVIQAINTSNADIELKILMKTYRRP